MTLALFPLQLVVYPNETLALHIFEQRYQNLIADCQSKGITFGVPTFLDNKMEYGTEVQLQRVVKRYPNGESDIICVGKRVFKMESFQRQLPQHLYAGGKVTFLKLDNTTEAKLQTELLILVEELYAVLAVEGAPQFKLPITSYDVAHKVGLSIEQEYHLLKVRSEVRRLQYIIDHLKHTLPVVKQMNRTKEVIKLNGHFKNFDMLDFEDFKL